MVTDSGEVNLELDLMAKLKQAIETVRERLIKYDQYIGEKEIRTRILVIDEILRGLGWEVTNPDIVQMELVENGNNIDYVLLEREQRYLAVVEAKRSKEGLSSKYRRQASGYATELGTKYVILTNGARWECWEIIPGQSRRDSNVVEANITTGDIENIASEIAVIHRKILGGAEQRTG